MKRAMLFAVMVAAAVVFAARAALPDKIECEGAYPYHVQGVATDGESLFWSFTTTLVKTDLSGKVLAKAESPAYHHMGDLTVHGGKVYVGMNMSGLRGRAGDEVWEYDAATLSRTRQIPTPETIWCNNGVAWCDGFFYVIGATPDHVPYNFVHVYTEDWKYAGARIVDSGWTLWGVQTIAAIDGLLFFGYYGQPDDPEMPHPSGAFVVNPDDLRKNWHNHERADVVPARNRFAGHYGEGILELEGKPWKCGGFKCPVPPGVDAKTFYGARLVPAPELSVAATAARTACVEPPKTRDEGIGRREPGFAIDRSSKVVMAGGMNHRGHLQGACSDGRHIYWSMTYDLVKTDLAGKVLASYTNDAFHMGDLCWHKGRIYVGVNCRMKDGVRHGDEVWVFEPDALTRERVIPTPQAVFCNNGLAWAADRFWVVTNAARNFPYNFLYEFKEDFTFVQCRAVATGWTNLGVQTICDVGGKVYLGTYGSPDGNNTFALDLQDLTRRSRNCEFPYVVPVSDRFHAPTGEGMFMLGDTLHLAVSTERKVVCDGKEVRRFGAEVYRTTFGK